ncbi:uncharacterized protein CMU_019160 [Cryptosporidium muris RN66]|uniref:Uncharacterized protein n=1 Tax=Cryptosporidium muris (strain RN66) TaxID=441375 RepID=B6ACA3_CRYMR|nr:uncharacterized protein CMU_019160 [Cryptosporidium muris RN66]EEA06159.1 hypothetical protein, conserved [Cryptosporidium muris RN66]|eukprot:XP_002140508.1 hypothetical protein [Cryptosporidium muris RN66]
MYIDDYQEFVYGSTRYYVQIQFDQPYYFSSDKLSVYITIYYNKNKNLINTLPKEYISKPEYIVKELSDDYFLDYGAIQLYGYTTNNINHFNLDHYNGNYNILNKLFGYKLNLEKNNQINTRIIFVSNPYVFISNLNLNKKYDKIGPFYYSCIIPPFLPPSFNGQYKKYGYFLLLTFGTHKNSNNNINCLGSKIQKRLRFDIKLFGSYPTLVNCLLSFSNIFKFSYPITSPNKQNKNLYLENNQDNIIHQYKYNYYNNEYFHYYQDFQLCKKQFIKNLEKQYQNKIINYKEILLNNSSNLKLRFFEPLAQTIDIQSKLLNLPKSILELYWQNNLEIMKLNDFEITKDHFIYKNIFYKKKNEILHINYQNQLVAICNISNINHWYKYDSINISFNMLNARWKTQEIHILINRIEEVKFINIDQINKSTKQIYNYKRCTLWDNFFQHNININNLSIIPSFTTDDIKVYYQLIIHFFIYTNKDCNNMEFLQIDKLNMIGKLTWISPPISIYQNYQDIFYNKKYYSFEINDQYKEFSNIIELFQTPSNSIFKLFPLNNLLQYKSIEM